MQQLNITEDKPIPYATTLELEHALQCLEREDPSLRVTLDKDTGQVLTVLCVCVYACVCVCACMTVCMYVCMYVCMRICVCVCVCACCVYALTTCTHTHRLSYREWVSSI